MENDEGFNRFVSASRSFKGGSPYKIYNLTFVETSHSDGLLYDECKSEIKIWDHRTTF